MPDPDLNNPVGQTLQSRAEPLPAAVSTGPSFPRVCTQHPLPPHRTCVHARRSTHLDYVALIMAGRGECQVTQEGQFIPLWRWHFYGIGASNITIVSPIADCAREIARYIHADIYTICKICETHLNNAWARRCHRHSHCVRHSICPVARRCCHCSHCPCTRTPRHDRRGTGSGSG